MIDGGYRNKVFATQDQINHYNFQVENIVEEILKRKTGQIILKGIRASGYTVVIRPDWGFERCNSHTEGRGKMYYGYVNVVVGFSPDASCHLDPQSRLYKPGGSPAESLFHELVHAFRSVTEKTSDRRIYPNPYAPPQLKKNPEYDFEEDFFTILITNIFSSETNLPLRAGHRNLEPLPPHLSTNEGFLAVEDYAQLVRQFCIDHRSVSRELSQVASAYNPIRGVLIGQGFQHLLDDQ